MELTNFFYSPIWGVLILIIFFYCAIVCTLLYKLVVKGEGWRLLKKLLMGFSLLLFLGIYEFLLYIAAGADGQLVSVPVLGAKLFICSSFFVFVFFQSAGFVADRYIHCCLFQLGQVVLLGLIDLMYWAGISVDESYRLSLAFVAFACIVLFVAKFFYVCHRRYDTVVQVLDKESLARVGLNASLLFLVSYFMLMGLLAKTGLFLGIAVLMMLGAFHIHILNRWYFSRFGTASLTSSCSLATLSGKGEKKSYRIQKVESSVEDMLMDGQPIDDYKIIQRLIHHFETRKPFLDSELKLADISKQIYTNRTYLSRALNQRLSKNFNQFVNYYRIKEACRLYIENPELKGHELAKLCGFKNLSSFSTAFSINLRYTPGEWCKEVKSRLNNKEDVSVKDYFS